MNLTTGENVLVYLLLAIFVAVIFLELWWAWQRDAARRKNLQRMSVGGIDSSPSPYWKNATDRRAELLADQEAILIADSTCEPIPYELHPKTKQLIAGMCWVDKNLGDVPYRHTFEGQPVEWEAQYLNRQTIRLRPTPFARYHGMTKEQLLAAGINPDPLPNEAPIPIKNYWHGIRFDAETEE